MGRSLHLTLLPNEILYAIFSYLDTPSLKATSLSSSWGYEQAATFLWSEVDLVDQTRDYSKEDADDQYGLIWGHMDEHDDTPIIQKLLLLTLNPFIASKVQTLTHRCHLPCPGIFNELPSISFKSRTLTSDLRTLHLLDKAIANMQQVRILRIIYGHWNMTLRLLYGFLVARTTTKLKRLWLENVCLEGFPEQVISRIVAPGLESVRIRRMHLYDHHASHKLPSFLLSRGGFVRHMVNGRAGIINTTTVPNPSDEEQNLRMPDQQYPLQVARKYDQYMYDNLPEVTEYLDHVGMNKTGAIPYGTTSPTKLTARLLSVSTQTLTSLNIDWVMWSINTPNEPMGFLSYLARLRFPNLTSFQLRNAVVSGTELPPNLFLLEPCSHGRNLFTDFIEAHTKLRCLAWPMDRFFSAKRHSPEVVSRARRIVHELGRTLVDLRVDAYYSHEKEPLTDQPQNKDEFEKMVRRRRFVEEFAPHMTKVRSLKMEGGMPRDEKRETVKAMAACPLDKIVFIGVSCPIGNTWGPDGCLLMEIDEGGHDSPGLDMEAEETINTYMDIVPVKQNMGRFNATYGWPPGPPMIHTVAAYHANTAKELKFCGYNGSPILYKSTPITEALLHPLRYFHHLEQLVLSMWLLTWHHGNYRDDSIIKYWLETSSPSSTALALYEPPEELIVDELDNLYNAFLADDSMDTLDTGPGSAATADAQDLAARRWSRTLSSMYSPEALAAQVARQIGPHLSDQAKARRGGVYVRTSFCLGVNTAADIFDLDVWIGAGNRVLGITPPRAEQEVPRRREKLEARRWF